jgi:hypothetical protein
MVLIEINSRPGVFLKLDKEVAEKIGDWCWHFSRGGYLVSHIPKSGHPGKKIRCARAVIWAATGEMPPSDMQVDHINHDKLDNRMCNLRVVTPSINARNQTGRSKRKSQYSSIHFDTRDGYWQGYSVIKVNGKNTAVLSSRTKDEEEAARARDCIAHKIGGFLVYNFPDESFEEKWDRIGERQRAQINRSLDKLNLYFSKVI